MNTTRRASARITSAASQRRQKPEPEPAVKKFIKIILPTIMEKMMKIPARFVRLGPKLTETVTIQTPVGFKRPIRIKRTGNKVWLEKGWSEFAEAHSINEGHFLYFCYEGNSSFRVMIFDVSASEIDYPMDKVHVIESDDDEVMEAMDTDDEEEGFTRVDSSDNDSSDAEAIDLENLLKKMPRVSVKSETITID
ncbi:B3 domain-containing protein [Raphanus sativus]|uniref:B3 domain-containing protein At1g49475 isoform X2 n=1 Tax=Raphanus sativus TaxID=3726 RepID=A0A6J0KP59_RAPSA|nr:B3 domain-containing protein At1g49475 isoform X2 [Raphanus sativus]KAJ4881878.1 B3 domain-containing protein [Raphanus sativus]